MQAENNSLSDQLRRALKELKAYEVKYPTAFDADFKKNLAGGDTNQEYDEIWSSQAVSPLLYAYDARKTVYCHSK